jgi:tetrahydromethanopterin S-methyltransferase subunit G
MNTDAKLDVRLLGFLIEDVPRIRADAAEAKRAAERTETAIGLVTSHMATIHTDFTSFKARTEEKFVNAERRLDSLDGEVGDTTQHTIITIQHQKDALEKQLIEKVTEEKRKAEIEETDKKTDIAKKADRRLNLLYSVLGGVIMLLVGSLLTSIYHRVFAVPPASASTGASK